MKWLTLTILLLVGAVDTSAQKVKFGASAALTRSFVYPQNFSTKGRYDYVKAEGGLGYQLGLYAEHAIGPKTAVDVGIRFLRSPTSYDVTLVVPNSFAITHTWEAKRQNYRLYSGLSHVVLARGNKKLRVFGGLLAGVEQQEVRIGPTGVSFYENPPSTLAVDLDYFSSNDAKFLWGAEAGVGLRLFNGVDLNLRYNYNFTSTIPIDYISTIVYNGPPGSPRQSSGSIKGRPLFAAAELVIWFN